MSHDTDIDIGARADSAATDTDSGIGTGADTAGTGSIAQLRAENERLRARLAALDAELAEVQARANAAVAAWQDRVYWLDRWHVDLNELMRRRGTAELRGALRAVRAPLRLLRKATRAMRS